LDRQAFKRDIAERERVRGSFEYLRMCWLTICIDLKRAIGDVSCHPQISFGKYKICWLKGAFTPYHFLINLVASVSKGRTPFSEKE
jgi:hypothetical protein